MSANTVQPDPNRYDPALGDPLAPLPTSGNDEVEAMCKELAEFCSRTCDEAAALIRKQAAQIDHLVRLNKSTLETAAAQIAELHMLLGGLQETYSAVLSPQMCAAIDAAIAKERQ